jgi:DNA-binding beta-propeller fold protein YncE
LRDVLTGDSDRLFVDRRSGDIAITPDGARAYVAAGLVNVIDTATNVVVRSFPAETATIPDVSNSALAVAISPDGTRWNRDLRHDWWELRRG